MRLFVCMYEFGVSLKGLKGLLVMDGSCAEYLFMKQNYVGIGVHMCVDVKDCALGNSIYKHLT